MRCDPLIFYRPSEEFHHLMKSTLHWQFCHEVFVEIDILDSVGFTILTYVRNLMKIIDIHAYKLFLK